MPKMRPVAITARRFPEPCVCRSTRRSGREISWSRLNHIAHAMTKPCLNQIAATTPPEMHLSLQEGWEFNNANDPPAGWPFIAPNLVYRTHPYREQLPIRGPQEIWLDLELFPVAILVFSGPGESACAPGRCSRDMMACSGWFGCGFNHGSLRACPACLQLECVHRHIQGVGLLLHRFGCGGGFFDQRGVLLGHFIHLDDRLVHLFDTRAMFVR